MNTRPAWRFKLLCAGELLVIVVLLWQWPW